MGHQFAAIAFTSAVRDIQSAQGSRAGYAGMDLGEDCNHRLGAREATFIASRDSCYIASVSETGWPCLQHRGGPAGFIKVLNESTLGLAVANTAKDPQGWFRWRRIKASWTRCSLRVLRFPIAARPVTAGRVR